RRFRCGDARRPNQDRFRQPHRSNREIQPIAPHRGRTGRRRKICGPQRVPAETGRKKGRLPVMQGSKKPLVLKILDGWGLSPSTEANAIAAARTPTYDML